MALLYVADPLLFPVWSAELRRHLPDAELRCWPDMGDAVEIDTALVWYPPAGLLAALPNLRLIHALGAGTEYLLDDPSLPRVPIVRLVDPYMTVAMEEYVLCQVLRLHRQDIDYLGQQRAQTWRERPQPNAEERRVGILGLGALGGEAVLRLKVAGFDVAGWSRNERRIKGIPCFHGADGLLDIAARSEILVCLLPLTPETENLLDYRLFAAMPTGAAIVNCARGGHVVDADLIAALDSGQLSAAVLDAFREEPLPAGHPFWRHPRIVITPHVAAATNPRTAAPLIAAALQRFAEGKPVQNLVDRSRGY